jgi:phenylalanine-4-hydroxylase
MGNLTGPEYSQIFALIIAALHFISHLVTQYYPSSPLSKVLVAMDAAEAPPIVHDLTSNKT